MSLVFKTFDLCSDSLTEVIKHLKTEVTIQKCGALLSEKKNLKDAKLFLNIRFPDKKNTLQSTYTTSVKTIDQNLEQLACLDRAIYDHILLYKVKNKDLDKNWPKWTFKLIDTDQ